MRKLALLLLASAPLYCATYYVSNSGSDLNAGTDTAKPFASLVKATSAMKKGDTLILDGKSSWFTPLIVPCDSCTFTRSGSSSPTIVGGIVVGNHQNVKISYIYVTKSTGPGISAVCSKTVNPNGLIIDHVIIDHTGYSGISVLACNYVGAPQITGVQITNNYIGRIDDTVGLDYNEAGIQLGGLTGALVQGNTVQTVTQMGIQDRGYYNATCSKNGFYKNNVSNNEGGITAICPNDDAAYNSIHDGRGFGLQIGVNGTAHDDKIFNLAMGTGGTLINGLDGKGGTGATYTRETVSNVSGCSITVEGAATGVKVNGGTYDATSGGKCALYVTADSMPVSFDGTTQWNVVQGSKSFKLGGLANQYMMDKATFLSKTSNK
jgi:hypothetical protein